MSELHTDQPIIAITDSFADYYHGISAKFDSAIVLTRDASRLEKLDLEALSGDLREQEDREFIDCPLRTSSAIVRSLGHEASLVGKLVEAQTDGPLLPGGFRFWAKPQASSEPARFSAKLTEELYAVGADEQAIREISVQHLNHALTKGGLNWLAANISALCATRRFKRGANYDPAYVRYDVTPNPGKDIRVETDHESLVTPVNMHTPSAIAVAYLGLLRTRPDSFVQA